MIDQKSTIPAKPKISRVEVYWHTVTYKTVAVYVLIAAAILFSVLYILSPNWYSTTFRKISTAIDNSDNESIAINQTQAKFVNLDGKVQVKKVDSVQWVEADFHTTLDKGDLVQTGPEGVARITFGDGTFYVVKKKDKAAKEVHKLQFGSDFEGECNLSRIPW